MRKSFLTICLLSIIFFQSKAQVSNIQFTQSMDTFQLINGTQVDFWNEDDIFHPNLPIGFSFVYNGNVVSKFGVCTNGFIVLDSLNHSGMWTPNVNSTNQINVLMADLMNTNAGGSIEYTTLGTAPNRVFVCQWKDYGIFGLQYCHMNAQIRILENSNCIQLCYGYNALSGNNGRNFYVGLTGTTTSDFNLRQTPSNWLLSSPSTNYPGTGMFLNPLSTLPSGLLFSYGTCPAQGNPFSYISGNVFKDDNNNGTRDASENGLANVLVHDNLQNYYTTTDTNGNYNLLFIDSSLTYSIHSIPLQYWTVSSTPNTQTVNPLTQSTTNINFGLHPTPNIHDVEIVSTSSNVPWPNATVSFFTTFHNLGTVIEPGDSIFFIKDSNYSFTSSTPAPAYISGDSIVWTYSNLLINEFRNINMQLHAGITIVAGDTLHSFWTIKPLAIDVNTLNNKYDHHQAVISSIDPNEKTVSPEGNITNTQELQYNIHFQNIGTAPANNVFIYDTLDANIDVSTFKLLGYSHPVNYTMSGNGNLFFTFVNINLPDSLSNEPASHGSVTYSVKPKVGLTPGSYIHNTASILFDFNAAIVTNTTQNMIIISTPEGIGNINIEDKTLNVYPNPASESITITSKNGLNNATINLYDLTGKIILQKTSIRGSNSLLNLSSLQKGIYLLEVIDNGKQTRRKIAIQ